MVQIFSQTEFAAHRSKIVGETIKPQLGVTNYTLFCEDSDGSGEETVIVFKSFIKEVLP